MTIVLNKFDERIRKFSDIQSFKQCDTKYVGEIGYFTDSLCHFKDLDNECTKDVLRNIYHGGEAGDYIFECGDGTYRYFLPEELLKSNKKEYRPLTNEEFLELYDSGKIHSIRKAGKEGYQVRYIITNIYASGEDGVRDIYLNFNGDDFGYGLGYLFKKDFEYFDGIEWKPFKMEK